MLNVESYTAYAEDKWKALLERLNGSPLHLPNVALFGDEAARPVYLLFGNGEEPAAAAIGLESSNSLFGLFRTRRHLYLPSIPACGKDALDKTELYESLIAFARKQGYKSLEIDARWGDDFREVELLRPTVRRLLTEFSIDLTPDIDTLLRAMHKKHRKNIRESLEYGLSIKTCDSPETFLVLRTMQQSSSERAAERGNAYDIQDEAFFRRLYDTIYKSGPGSVLFAYSGDECVAALAYLAFGKRAITVRSGSTEKGYATAAMYALQYELIRSLKDLGYTELNIGGVPAEAAESSHAQHGLYNYKRYYGGEPHMRTSVYLEW